MLRNTILILCLGLPCAASADVYTWKDAAGHVHYSDQPPSDQAKRIRSPASQSDQAVAAQRDLADKDLAFRKRQEDAAKAREKAGKEAEAARIRQENCERARSNLAAMNENRRMYTTGPGGQHNYMDDQQQADIRAMSEKAVAENCR
jgi:hypothetical protein